MAYTRRHRSGIWLPDEKPPYPGELIVDHPLAQGLVFYTPFHEGAGSGIYNLITEVYYTPEASFTWDGGNVVFTPYRRLSINDIASFCAATGQGTMIICAAVTIDSSHEYVMSMRYGSNGERYYLKYNSGFFDYGWNDTATISTGVSWPLYIPCQAAMSWDISVGCSVYFNGKSVATTSAVSAKSPTLAMINGLCSYSSTVYSLDGIGVYAAVYDRVLSPSEIAWLHAEPYDMIQPRKERKYFFIPASSGITVTADTVSLYLTQYPANVSVSVAVDCEAATLTLTEYAATVSVSVAVDCDTATLTLTEYPAGIKADTNISAGTDALVLTEHNAVVSGDLNVEAETASLTLTEYAANINAAVTVDCETATWTLAEYAATIKIDTTVQTEAESLILTEYGANINAEISVQAAMEALTLTEYAATVATSIYIPELNVEVPRRMLLVSAPRRLFEIIASKRP